MKKAPEAFRTISEVAEILETPAHVLRFWESKFYQIRPVKRAGGRRYYRPDDVALINGIKVLLQDQGMTIRGVQRVLQEQGVKHVAGLGMPLPSLASAPEDDSYDESLEETASEMDDAAVGALPGEEADGGAESAGSWPGPEPALDPPANLDPEPSVVLPFVATATPVEPAQIEDEDRAIPDVARDEPEIAETAAPAGAQPEEEAPGVDDRHPEPVAARAQASDAPDDTGSVAELAEIMEPSERALIARRLRSLARNGLGPNRDHAELLARRIDGLLERMSEASGAGRW